MTIVNCVHRTMYNWAVCISVGNIHWKIRRKYRWLQLPMVSMFNDNNAITQNEKENNFVMKVKMNHLMQIHNLCLRYSGYWVRVTSAESFFHLLFVVESARFCNVLTTLFFSSPMFQLYWFICCIQAMVFVAMLAVNIQ